MGCLVECYTFFFVFYLISVASTQTVDISSASSSSPSVLNCSAGNPSTDFGWKYNGATQEGETKITLNIVDRLAAGVYTCIQNNVNVTSFNAQTLQQPRIEHHGQSIVLKNKQHDAKLVCESGSSDITAFEWLFTATDNMVSITNGNNANYIPTVDLAQGETILTISRVGYSARGTYHCRVFNTLGNSTGNVFVRVHDDLDFLWPLIGIVAEVVFVLCIILIVRRKSSEDKLVDEAPLIAPSSGSENANSSENSNVRQRPIRS